MALKQGITCGSMTKLWRLNASRSPPNIARVTCLGDTYIRVAQAGTEQKDSKVKNNNNINYMMIKNFIYVKPKQSPTLLDLAKITTGGGRKCLPPPPAAPNCHTPALRAPSVGKEAPATPETEHRRPHCRQAGPGRQPPGSSKPPPPPPRLCCGNRAGSRGGYSHAREERERERRGRGNRAALRPPSRCQAPTQTGPAPSRRRAGKGGA